MRLIQKLFAFCFVGVVAATPLLAQQPTSQKVRVIPTARAVAPQQAVRPPSVKTTSSASSIGGFRFDVFSQLTLENDGDKLIVTMVGSKSERVQIYTRLYDLRAERVRLDADKSGRDPISAKPRHRVTQATSDGSVRIVVRRENGGKDVIECDRAVFDAAERAPVTANDTIGRIIVTGNVRHTPMGYGFDGTFEADKGVIEILSRSKTTVKLDRPKGVGNAVEPAPKPRPTVPKGSG